MRVYYFENLRRFMHYSSFPPIPYFLPVIARREIESYEIVHIHDFRNLFSVLGFHYASKKGIPYVLQCHGSVLPFFEKVRMKRLFDLT